MPQMPESKHLARAIRRHGIGLVGAHGQKLMRGTIVDTSPLSVELTTNDIVIEEDHLLLGSWVRYFDSRFGLSPGDDVLLTCLDDGDWFVADVISQEDFNLGDHPELGTVTPYNTGSGHVVAEVPYKDSDGTVIGVLLLYDAATLRDFAGHTTAAGSGAPVVPN